MQAVRVELVARQADPPAAAVRVRLQDLDPLVEGHLLHERVESLLEGERVVAVCGGGGGTRSQRFSWRALRLERRERWHSHWNCVAIVPGTQPR